MIKINGSLTPTPSSFDWELQPQSSSAERNSNGLLNRETLPDKIKLVCQWKYTETPEFNSLLVKLRGLTRIFFNVTYPDPCGSEKTIEVYLSPVSCSMLNCGGVHGTRWQNLKVTFIER